MKTADQIIVEIKELPATEQQKIVAYVDSIRESVFHDVDGASVSEEWILEEVELCKQGVDVEVAESVDDFCQKHGLT